MTEKPVFAIGDVQGRFERLEGLLLQEGIIGPCEVCAGSGDVSGPYDSLTEFCPQCKGSGTARINRDVVVVQLGDLIDARHSTQTTDSMCTHFGDIWLDYVLWGNHDRPVIDSNPGILFGGYTTPLPETVHRIKLMRHEGRYRLAYYAHGFLLVHAGLPAEAAYEKLGATPEGADFADYLNRMDREVLDKTVTKFSGAYYEGEATPEIEAFIDLRDSISRYRGGWDAFGGLLWRDEREPLYPARQIFAHSSAQEVRTYGDPPSYCLDVSKHGGVAGIWLPDERVVEFRA